MQHRAALLAPAFLITAIVGALAAPAVAGEPTDQLRTRIARHADGPFRDRIRRDLDEGRAKNVYLKVRSLTGQDEGAVLQDLFGVINLKKRYFKNNGEQITAAVTSLDGHPFTVRGDKPRRFRLRIKQTGSEVSTCFGISAISDDDGGFSTAVLDINIARDECS